MDFSAHHSVKLVKIRISQASHSVPTCMGCAPECSQSRVTWQTSRLKQGSTVVDLKAQLWTPIQRSSDTFIAASAKPPCCASMQCSLLKRNHCTIKASAMHYTFCTMHSALCSYPGQDCGHSCEHRSGQNAHQSSDTFIAASAKPPRLC